MPSAGLVIVGNEILTGKIADQNTPFLTRRLWELGVEVRRIWVVPDELEEIAAVVREASAACDFVLTSGGLGPTHDDVTVAGVGRAFGRPLTRYPEVEDLVRRYYRTSELSPAQARMALLPEGARLVYPDGARYPQLVVENVYIFPGVPELLRKKFEEIASQFQGEPFQLERLDLEALETDIAEDLDQAVARFPEVRFGSYPYDPGTGWRVQLTLESRSGEALRQALQFLKERL